MWEGGGDGEREHVCIHYYVFLSQSPGGDLGDECSDTSPCKDGLSCIDKKCGCDSDSQYISNGICVPSKFFVCFFFPISEITQFFLDNI